MKDIVIIGASGFGREVAWLIERINQKKQVWDLKGFLDDDNELIGKTINGYKVLGQCDKIRDMEDTYAVCAIGSSKARKSIIDRITSNKSDVRFATLIDPTVEMSNYVNIGEGSIICAHTIITVNVDIGKHNIINLDCTIGHQATLADYVTLYPSVNISGNAEIGTCSELGTGMQILQGRTIGYNTIVGSGAVVTENIPKNCIAVGMPAKPIKKNI